VKKAIWVCFILATAAAALVARPALPQEERGEQILNQSCISCHDVRRIQVQALDAATWTAKVNSMIEKGAKVEPDNLPILLDYLVKQHGPLPDGPGKSILLNTCTRCHDLKRVKEHGATRRQWAETLLAMLNEGAPLSDEELPVILEYLAATFPPLR
jgi:cytochrome c5